MPPLAIAPPVGVEVARIVSSRCLTSILKAGAAGDACADFHDQYFAAHAGSWSRPLMVLPTVEIT